ncbi:LapA family protein [Solihabitans fulvus]|uniref:LapA family protein n=1 Tax=Solihabitans fulvus TaxID=1892852 RepID=A0A5B2XG35_9PSEU|nr:LapA family protein [Solihabitans fulvus]KAA2262236.1 LapA family protein [Solihabitans fulvus]
MNLSYLFALSFLLGLQTGCMLSWRYHRRQRDGHDAQRAEHQRRIDRLERELEWALTNRTVPSVER